jgi:hypothetical protein
MRWELVLGAKRWLRADALRRSIVGWPNVTRRFFFFFCKLNLFKFENLLNLKIFKLKMFKFEIC